MKKFEAWLMELASKIIAVAVTAGLVVKAYTSLSAAAQAFVVVMIPSVSAFVIYRLVKTRRDAEDARIKLGNLPFWLVLIGACLNFWALRIILLGWQLGFHNDPLRSWVELIGLALLSSMAAWVWFDDGFIERLSPRGRFDPIWGHDAAEDQTGGFRQLDIRSTNDVLTGELMRQREAERHNQNEGD